MKNRYLVISLILVSFALLIPGVIKPIFVLSLDTEVNSQLANISANVLSQKRSIVDTVEHLFQDKRYLVSFLILFFSILLPLFKGMALLTSLSKKIELRNREKLRKLVGLISKWSMADIFVVAIFLAFLATSEAGSTHNTTISVMGMSLPIKLNSVMKSSLGEGFYFFLAYCLLSNLTSLMAKRVDK